MSTHFISDLHLDASHPETIQHFFAYLHTHAKEADALYILGDLFEVWMGDDAETPITKAIAAELRDLADSGVPIFYLHGNRDFLLGSTFAKQSGFELLPDPWVFDLYGIRTLLLHGDTLCTEDKRYLQVRARYRRPFFKHLFLSLPLFIRKSIATRLRKASLNHVSTLSMNLMDSTQSEIEGLMRTFKAQVMIHGHTHRPTIQHFQLDDKLVSRIVLSDWNDKSGNVLIINKDGTQRLIYI